MGTTFKLNIRPLTEDQRAALLRIIAHLEATTDDQWCVGVCRKDEDGREQNCIIGHIFNMGKDDREGSAWVDGFSESIATTYMIFPVNDGEHPRYQQATPRERCLAYLWAVLEEREAKTWDWDCDYKEEPASPD